MGYGSEFVFTLFTNDPQLALQADLAGVNRIGLDVEHIGKDRRQRKCSFRQNDHHPSQLASLAQVVRAGKLFCRTNSPHPGLRQEVEDLLAHGVQVLMLPYFATVAQAEEFVSLVAGRALVCLLVENEAAARLLPELVRVAGVDEIHVGLNDLQLSLTGGCQGRWELLAADLLARMADTVRSAGLPFGLGSLGRSRDNTLPIPSDLLYPQWPRLGAQGALISRHFLGPDWRRLAIKSEVQKARQRLETFAALDPGGMQGAKEALLWWVGNVANP